MNAENPQQAAIAGLRAAFQYWREDNAYYRISMWAFLEGRDDLIAQEIKLTAELAQTIQTMQADGQADTDFAPYAFLPMTIGPLHFWMSHRALFKEALGLAGDLETLDAQFEEQYLQMLCSRKHWVWRVIWKRWTRNSRNSFLQYRQRHNLG